MACVRAEVILVLICVLGCTDGRVNCTDAEECSYALVYEGCTKYPVSYEYRVKCPQTCAVCSSTTQECSEGYIEVDGRCDPCSVAVYVGLNVTEVNCPQCPNASKYGPNCSVDCYQFCRNGCDRWSKRCNGCKWDATFGTGRYGSRCEDKCSSFCQKRTCQQDDGSCSHGCVPGYYGSRCDKHCPRNCLCEDGKTCLRGLCGEQGTCIHGCRQGFYGGDCSSPCPSGCVKNACSKEGRCLACEEGWYGDQCQLPCSATCRQKQCQQSTGFCTHGCEAGFWGEACNSRCPDTCVTCSAASQCFLCKDGWHGEACQRPCHDYCRGGCNHLGVCHQCVDGFYGSECNHACKNCASSVRGAPVCSRDSGRCSQGCKNGFFGPRCDAPCSQRCLESTCTGLFPEQGGNCTKGCQDGYRGLYCQAPCPVRCQTCSQLQVGCGQCQEGWYGLECEERCQDCPGTCRKDTGLCLKTCTGPQKRGTADSYDPESGQCVISPAKAGSNIDLMIVIVISLAGVLLVLMLAIIAGVCCYKQHCFVRGEGEAIPMVDHTDPPVRHMANVENEHEKCLLKI